MITEADMKAAGANIAVRDALKTGRVVTIEEYMRVKRHEFLVGIMVGLSVAVLFAGIVSAITLH